MHLKLIVFFFLFGSLFTSSGYCRKFEPRREDPPQVSIIWPLNGSVFESDRIRIDYVISGSAPRSARILIDDRPVQLLTDIAPGQNTAVVDLPERDCKISIIVQNKFGASVPAIVNLNRSEHVFKPVLYILAIGISNYADPTIRLQFAAKDAIDFSQTMLKQEELLYEKVNLRLLTDRDANAENIRDGLHWLQTETTFRDIAMLYMAGHGVNNNVGDFFFMPVNADINRINATCVGYSEIKGTVDAVAGKMLVFMDACHSGNVLGNSQRRATLISQAVNDLTGADNGVIVFTSSTGRQFSLENPEWNNGAFTKALVEGLNGHADLFGRNIITVKNLDSYVANRVKELTRGQQAPTTIIPTSLPDFPIAVVTDISSPIPVMTEYIQTVSLSEEAADMGDKYFYGIDTQRDCREAEMWYRKSAEEGNAYAQNQLGEMYGIQNPYGCHIRTDYSEALKWFRQSAAQNYADAQFNIGVMYQYGYGVPMSLNEALRWFRLSAEQGNSAAKLIMEGVNYE